MMANCDCSGLVGLRTKPNDENPRKMSLIVRSLTFFLLKAQKNWQTMPAIDVLLCLFKKREKVETFIIFWRKSGEK